MNTRSYKMTSRADDAERTGHRIVDAMLQRFATLPYGHIRLEDIAADAGVTVQTVLRRFGSKSALLSRLSSANSAGSPRAAPRSRAPRPRDHRGSRRPLRDLRNVDPQDVCRGRFSSRGLANTARRGREYHVAWCRSAFGVEPFPGSLDDRPPRATLGADRRGVRCANVVHPARRLGPERLPNKARLLELLLPLVAEPHGTPTNS